MTKNQREFQKEITRIIKEMMAIQSEHKFVQIRELTPNMPKKITKAMVDDLKGLEGKHFFAEADVNAQTLTPLVEDGAKGLRFTTEQFIPTYDMFEDLLQLFLDAEQQVDMLWKDETNHDYRYNIILKCIDIMYTQREQYGKLYSMWLSNKEEDIAEALNVIVYASVDAVANSYTSLILILNTELSTKHNLWADYKNKLSNSPTYQQLRDVIKNDYTMTEEDKLDLLDQYKEQIMREMGYKESTLELLKEIGEFD